MSIINNHYKLVGYSSDDIIPAVKKKKKRKFTSNKCCYCTITLTPDTFSKEHVVPKSRGGKKVEPCCVTCNREKSDMSLIAYIAYLYSYQRLFSPYAVEYIVTGIKIRSAEQLKLKYRLN